MLFLLLLFIVVTLSHTNWKISKNLPTGHCFLLLYTGCSLGGRVPPFFGLPRLTLIFFCLFPGNWFHKSNNFCTVSGDMTTRCSDIYLFISASRFSSGSLLSANSANAWKKVDSFGIWYRVSLPHILRNTLLLLSMSNTSRIVEQL